jgi:HSP20 family molecular chaperone IbpA
VDIYESEEGLYPLADMPGVDRENLSIDLKDSVLDHPGHRQKPG